MGGRERRGCSGARISNAQRCDTDKTASRYVIFSPGVAWGGEKWIFDRRHIVDAMDGARHGDTDKTASKYIISTFRGSGRRKEAEGVASSIKTSVDRMRGGQHRDTDKMASKYPDFTFWARERCWGRCSRHHDRVGIISNERRCCSDKTASKYPILTFQRLAA